MKAVFFDLDDTLLRDDLTISDFSVRVFKRMRENGYFIVPSSGRACLSMKPFVDRLSCVNVFISCNGAEIWNEYSATPLFQELFPVETAVSIAEFAEKHDCYAQVYEGNRFFYSRRCIYAERYAASSRLEGCYVGKLSDYIHKPRNKILMIDEESKITLMYKEACSLFAGIASVTCSKPWYLEFNPLSATKGIALRKVAEFLKVDLNDTIAIGDSLNDLSMLQAAGIGVAVDNGRDELKNCSDFICGGNNEDGPAHFLNNYCLHGEVVP